RQGQAGQRGGLLVAGGHAVEGPGEVVQLAALGGGDRRDRVGPAGEERPGAGGAVGAGAGGRGGGDDDVPALPARLDRRPAEHVVGPVREVPLLGVVEFLAAGGAA